jgi:hypothetical protein
MVLTTRLGKDCSSCSLIFIISMQEWENIKA